MPMHSTGNDTITAWSTRAGQLNPRKTAAERLRNDSEDCLPASQSVIAFPMS